MEDMEEAEFGSGFVSGLAPSQFGFVSIWPRLDFAQSRFRSVLIWLCLKRRVFSIAPRGWAGLLQPESAAYLCLQQVRRKIGACYHWHLSSSTGPGRRVQAQLDRHRCRKNRPPHQAPGDLVPLKRRSSNHPTGGNRTTSNQKGGILDLANTPEGGSHFSSETLSRTHKQSWLG